MIIMAFYIVGALITWVIASSFWIKEFNAEGFVAVAGYIWGIMVAAVWPVFAIGFSLAWILMVLK